MMARATTRVEVATATGKARNVLYAMWVCNGYNPLDSMFWSQLRSHPPSDKAWDMIKDLVVVFLGEHAEVPTDLL
jgi:hypothetical protein